MPPLSKMENRFFRYYNSHAACFSEERRRAHAKMASAAIHRIISSIDLRGGAVYLEVLLPSLIKSTDTRNLSATRLLRARNMFMGNRLRLPALCEIRSVLIIAIRFVSASFFLFYCWRSCRITRIDSFSTCRGEEDTRYRPEEIGCKRA